MMIAACLKVLGTHPELIQRQDALLCSINDRLGSLIGSSRGRDLPELGSEWLAEVLGAMSHQGKV